MKAIINKKYGLPDMLALREVDCPEPKPHEVLVKVLAASVNKTGWRLLRGKSFPIRLMAGLRKSKYQMLGADIVDVVLSVWVARLKKTTELPFG